MSPRIVSSVSPLSRIVSANSLINDLTVLSCQARAVCEVRVLLTSHDHGQDLLVRIAGKP